MITLLGNIASRCTETWQRLVFCLAVLIAFILPGLTAVMMMLAQDAFVSNPSKLGLVMIMILSSVLLWIFLYAFGWVVTLFVWVVKWILCV
jgi:hypothetical protein